MPHLDIRRTLTYVGVLAIITPGGMVASAQETPAPLETGPQTLSQPSVEDIIVTARRRDERVLDVPIAVTVVSPSDLKEKSIRSFQDLATAVPSFQFQPDSFGKSNPIMTIRSQRQSSSLITVDPSVAVYFADVVQARAEGINAALFDIASVQVLKGPQGTLFGRNTTGGALIITPQAPTPDFEGYGQVTLGRFDQRILEAAVNVPLSDKLQIRLAGQINRRDGFIRDVDTGRDLEDDHNESWRASILWQPSDDFTNRLVVNGFHADENGTGGKLVDPLMIPSTTPVALRDAAVAALARLNQLGRYETLLDAPTEANIRTFAISNTSELHQGGLTFKNIIGYREVDSRIIIDQDGSPVPLILGTQFLDEKQFSDEFQILGKAFNDQLDYIFGAYYFSEWGDSNGGNMLNGTLQRSLGGFVSNESASVFAQGTYKLPFAPAVSLTAGVRQTWDKRAVRLNSSQGPIGGPLACVFTVNDVPLASGGVRISPCSVTRNVSFKKPTYTLSADWKVASDTLVYFTHRQGYRSGGFNMRSTTFAQLTPFEPEVVKDYEVGLKSQWRLGGMRGTLNVAAYYQDYSNIQRLQGRVDSTGTFAGSTITNAASATVKGVEVDGSIRPFRGLEISAYYSYSRPKYKEWLIPRVVGGVVVFDDFSGSDFAGAPRNSGGGSIRYSLPVSEKTGEVAISGNIYSQQRTAMQDGLFNPITQTMFPTAYLPGYTIINARAEWNNIMSSGFSIAGVVRNLTNKFYYSSGTDLTRLGVGTLDFVAAAPRTWSVELRYDF